MSVPARRWRLPIAVGVMLALACVTVDVIDVAGDPAVSVGMAIVTTAGGDAVAAQASRAERRPAEYHPRLYRADVRRPKDWGS